MVSAQVSAGSGQMRESFWKSAVIPTSLRGSQQWGPCGSAAFQGGGGRWMGKGGGEGEEGNSSNTEAWNCTSSFYVTGGHLSVSGVPLFSRQID